MKTLKSIIFATLFVVMGTLSPVMADEYQPYDASQMTDEQVFEAQRNELEAMKSDEQKARDAQIDRMSSTIGGMASTSVSFLPIIFLLGVASAFVGFIAHMLTITKTVGDIKDRATAKKDKEENAEEATEASHKSSQSSKNSYKKGSQAPRRSTDDEATSALGLMCVAEDRDAHINNDASFYDPYDMI